VQNRLALPFLIVMVPLVIAAPFLSIIRSPLAPYVMPAVTGLLGVMVAAILLYNKISLGKWLPGRTPKM
jgi:hypothetical protein